MDLKDDIINYIVKKKLFSLAEIKKIKESDLAFLSTKISAKKIKINYGTIDVEETLTDEEIKDFIEKTNPYISQDKDIIKYTKKANFINKLRNYLISYYDKSNIPIYYLIVNMEEKSFICPSDIPQWFVKKFLDSDVNCNDSSKPLLCWNLDEAEMVYNFVVNPFEKLGIKHSFSIRAFNSENEVLEHETA